MPELPEVETVKRGLAKAIIGKKIKSVEIRLPKIVALGPAPVSNVRRGSAKTAAAFVKLVRGHRIVGLNRRAKILFIDLAGPLSILVHLKMTGQLIFAKPKQEKIVKIFNIANSPKAKLPHKYTHVIFTFSDGSKLFYNDLRQFGYLRLVKDEDRKQVRELAEFGPEPFDKEFTLDYLRKKAARRPSLSIKQFLMDPGVIAGIGNIYSDEILYWAALRPKRPVRSLLAHDWRKLYEVIPKVLREALRAQGSSVGDFFKVDGSEGRYGLRHMVYGRYGENCKECGEVIKKVKLGGRTGSYCPVCQS